MPASTWHVPADLLAVSAALPVGLGIWRGQTITVWRDADGAWWRQGSMLTLALWGALIAARGLLYRVDAALGHRKAPGLRAILLTLALSFAAHNAVSAARMNAAPRSPRARRLNRPPAAVWSSPRVSAHGRRQRHEVFS